MQLKGVAKLPLHYGKAPKWLYEKMVKLATSISKILVFEYGEREMLRRLSDPFWFQALGCTLGFDWHSSGLTTTLTAALRDAFKKAEIGLWMAGGKGKTSKKVPNHIEKISQEAGLSENKIKSLIEASRIIAKTDNSVLQDSYDIYHHVIIFDDKARYSIVQQGMNEFSSYARRYHWLYETIEEKGYFNDSHQGIITAFKLSRVIDLSSSKARNARLECLDLAKEKPEILKKELAYLNLNKVQRTLHEWIDLKTNNHKFIEKKYKQKIKELIMQSEHEIFSMPKKINWKALREAYEKKPKDFKELICIGGIGKGTIKALALISTLIYGNEQAWEDPAAYSFVHGGKDGVPYPIDKLRYEKSIHLLQDAIKNAEIGKKDKLNALRRLKNFVE